MGLAQEIMQIVLASIPPELAGARVARVHLRVGRLAAVVPDSLRFCFGAVTQETALAGAELAIREVPVEARCRRCQHQWIIDTPAFACPRCQGPSIEMLSGRELDIDSIEVAEEEPPDPDAKPNQ